MRIITSTLVGTALLGLVGCGMDTKKSRKKTEETLNLYGEWEQHCQTYDFLGLSHLADQVKFNPADAFEQKTRIFGKNACNNPLGEIIISGTFEVKDDSPMGGGAKDLNFTVKTAEVRPQEDELVTVLNTAKYCGFDNWEKNKSKDILNRNCVNAKYTKDMIIYDVYKRDGDTIYLGKSNSLVIGKEAGKRPTALNTDAGYSKSK